MSDTAAKSSLARATPALALVLYVGLAIAGLMTILFDWQDLRARQESVAATRDRAALFSARGGPARPDAPPDDLPRGGAYLAGDRLSVASADLQKRVSTAVAQAGGSVLSSQLERQEAKDQDTGVELNVECDIDQPGLQRLLYELESTGPFLFVEALNIKTRKDRKSTRLNSSHVSESRMPSSA